MSSTLVEVKNLSKSYYRDETEIVVLRVLAPVVEPAMKLLRRTWQAWRAELWKLPASSPRIWAM